MKILLDVEAGMHISSAMIRAVVGGYSHFLFNDRLHKIQIDTEEDTREDLRQHLVSMRKIGVTAVEMDG